MEFLTFPTPDGPQTTSGFRLVLLQSVAATDEIDDDDAAAAAVALRGEAGIQEAGLCLMNGSDVAWRIRTTAKNKETAAERQYS